MYFDPDELDPLEAEIATLPIEMQRRIFAFQTAAAYVTATWRLENRSVESIDEAVEAIGAQARRIEAWLRKGELVSMPYPDYLQTPEWQARRAAALERAQHRCQVCNREERLEVHHRTYVRRGDERDDDLTVLCHRCHDGFHKLGALATPSAGYEDAAG